MVRFNQGAIRADCIFEVGNPLCTQIRIVQGCQFEDLEAEQFFVCSGTFKSERTARVAYCPQCDRNSGRDIRAHRHGTAKAGRCARTGTDRLSCAGNSFGSAICCFDVINIVIETNQLRCTDRTVETFKNRLYK